MKYRKLAHTLWVSSESANAAGCKPVFFGSSWGGTNLAHQKVNSSTRLAQWNSDSLPAARQHPTVDDKGSRELICSVGQAVKTQDFHSCITSSTLVPSTIGSANSISTIREQCTRLPLTKLRYKKIATLETFALGKCVFESHYLLQWGNCVSASRVTRKIKNVEWQVNADSDRPSSYCDNRRRQADAG